MTGGNVRVAIIGAGMSGLYMAKRYKERGIPFTIYEKSNEIGGTWRENTYPGLTVDIPTSRYHLSWAPKHDWSSAYAPGSEIQRYLLDVADSHGLREHIQFGTEFTSARWINGCWVLRTEDGVEVEADLVVGATGFLHRPTYPDIPGMKTYAGPSFHSARWDHRVEITGQRIGVIGTGSSGIQIVSALAFRDCHVTQFVRTPQWVETVKNPRMPRLVRAIIRAIPRFGPAAVRRLEKRIEQDPRLQDPAWKLQPGPARDAAMEAFRDFVHAVRDPELRSALTPDFPPGCKRIPKSPRYYEAVQRPNVTIARGGVAEIVPNGLVMADGTLHELDVLVYATGFDAHAYVRPMQVVGLHHKTLDEVWGDHPFSYRGVSVPWFPNWFFLNGPFSPVNNLPVPEILDHETGYVVRLTEMFMTGGDATAPSSAATHAFRERILAALPNTIWSSGCTNMYRDKSGTVVVWPWVADEHKRMFDDLAVEDLEFVSRATAIDR